jgi:(R,R)-butanediol dehydrogenase/meso-butanediol dehydrogenase/diacetyl reductase
VSKLLGAQYHGKGKMELVDIPKPSPQKDEALIKVKYAGICGSDLEAYKTGLYPAHIILGHEITGVIAELGPEVKRWKIGDRVTIFPSITCKKCYYCKQGLTNLCALEDTIGIGFNGGFAEYVLVKEENLVFLPHEIPDKFGTVFDQIATALLALREVKFIMGDSAVILGLGTMGQFLLQCLKLAGARPIVVVEKNLFRLEIAKQFEPDIALEKITLPKIKRANKKGVSGSDFVFECSGVPFLVNAAIDLVRKGGTIIQIGLWDRPLEINLLKYVMNQNRLQGVYGYLKDDFEFAIELVAKKLINPEPIITKIIRLKDIVEAGFECAINPETKDIKILVEP